MNLIDRRRQVAKKIAEEVCRAEKPGERRDALLFQCLTNKKFIPRDADFMQAFLWLLDKKTGAPIQWIFNRPQKLVFYLQGRRENANKPVRDAILKARKWGMSSGMVGKYLTRVLRSEHWSSAIVAKDGKLALELLDVGKFMRSRLPFSLPVIRDNRNTLSFGPPISGRVDIASAEEREPCRGGTYRSIHCTETAFWQNPEQKMISIEGALVGQAPTLTHESTANGIENFWYDFWWKARRGESDYFAFFFPWFFDPKFDYAEDIYPFEEVALLETIDDEERSLLAKGVALGQLKWRRKKINTGFFGDNRLFDQEYPVTPEQAFLASGLPAFSPELVATALHSCTDPVWRGDLVMDSWDESKERGVVRSLAAPRGALKIWRHPEGNKAYVMGIDTGHGLNGGDYSTVSVREFMSGEQVATYRGILPPREFAEQIACIGWLYNGAYAMPEVEGPGIATLQFLTETGYYHVGLRPNFGSPGKPIQNKLGWSTNRQTRPMLINQTRANLSAERGSGIRDDVLCKELFAMQLTDRGEYDVPKGKHDDMIFADAICLMALKIGLETGMAEEIIDAQPRSRDERHWDKILTPTDKDNTETWWEEWETT